MLLGMIQVQFYMFFEIKTWIKDGTLHTLRGEHIDTKNILSNTFMGGSTLFKSKWLVVNQNHHIIQIKLISGHPKPPHCSSINENG